jgi:hypothetical protein
MKKDAATRLVAQDVADLILRDRRSLDLLRSATWGTEDEGGRRARRIAPVTPTTGEETTSCSRVDAGRRPGRPFHLLTCLRVTLRSDRGPVQSQWPHPPQDHGDGLPCFVKGNVKERSRKR